MGGALLININLQDISYVPFCLKDKERARDCYLTLLFSIFRIYVRIHTVVKLAKLALNLLLSLIFIYTL